MTIIPLGVRNITIRVGQRKEELSTLLSRFIRLLELNPNLKETPAHTKDVIRRLEDAVFYLGNAYTSLIELEAHIKGA